MKPGDFESREYDFNPRSPGESDEQVALDKQSYDIISIHALLGRATLMLAGERYYRAEFQSTLSWGERHDHKQNIELGPYISIHALLGRATFKQFEINMVLIISIHALLGRATGPCPG